MSIHENSGSHLKWRELDHYVKETYGKEKEHKGKTSSGFTEGVVSLPLPAFKAAIAALFASVGATFT